jgi:ppGpp synthetase/RelA/SpoT-type nucleotidyltranferase
MIAKEDFLKKYNISEEYFEDAAISWEDLTSIYEDYENVKKPHYEKVLFNFEKDFLGDLDSVGVHSKRTRVKDAEHVIEKIIRKRKEKYSKYKSITADNYEKFLTDLIGIRCFILFKEQWSIFHKYIITEIENNPQCYVHDSLTDFDEDSMHCYHEESPKVHIRNGDRRDIYENILSDDCIESDKIYRSIHYIIKYEGVYLEIQVRTLYEESWGEIDHAIVYPKYTNNPIMKQYTELLNRMSGLADEMASFFRIIENMGEKKSEVQVTTSSGERKLQNISTSQHIESSNEEQKEDITPNDCIEAIMRE